MPRVCRRPVFDWLILHQANIRIIQATKKRLGVPMERRDHARSSRQHLGGRRSACARRGGACGRLRPGHRIVVEGVGGGFTWGAAPDRFLSFVSRFPTFDTSGEQHGFALAFSGQGSQSVGRWRLRRVRRHP